MTAERPQRGFWGRSAVQWGGAASREVMGARGFGVLPVGPEAGVREAVAAAGSHADGVLEGIGQVRDEKVKFLCVGAPAGKYFVRVVQQLGSQTELHRFGVVGQAREVAGVVVGAQGGCPYLFG